MAEGEENVLDFAELTEVAETDWVYIITAAGLDRRSKVLNLLARAIAAKGDLVVGSGERALDVLPAEDDGDILMLDAAEDTGMRWDGILTYLKSGWVPVTETWTYASATTVTTPGDLTGKYSVGMKARYKQGGAFKYGVIVGVSYSDPSTTITIAGGSDYTIAEAAITDLYYSTGDPYGFPDWFNWSPSLTGWSSDPSSPVYRFKISGRKCLVSVSQPNDGTSNATSIVISAPVAAATVAGATWGSVPFENKNNGTVQTGAGRAQIASGASDIYVYLTLASGAWTASGAKRTSFVLEYEI